MSWKMFAVSVAVTCAAGGVFAAESPTITMEQARKIALKRVNGTIESGELEREKGKLIYSFDIRVAHQTGITEVAVDAMKGNVVDVHHETPAQEAKEDAGKSKH